MLDLFKYDYIDLSAADIINLINTVITALFGLFLLYRTVYMIVGLFLRVKYPEVKNEHTYAFLVAARNESKVIGKLIESIIKQNYPADKLSVFVVADNCTDNTAEICRSMGCIVYERFNDKQIGKGYALKFLTENIQKDYGMHSFDGYFIFDADNLLACDYVFEMNKAFDNGNKIVTSYRNVKNFDTNLISASYGYHHYRNSRTLHIPRSKFNFSCTVTGTGFLVASEILKNGWQWELITEDIEFSSDCILNGYKIVFCQDAEFFDEQPTDVKTMWRQRVRWSKGILLTFVSHLGKIIKTFLTPERRNGKKAEGSTDQNAFQRKFTYYDLFWQIFPSALVLFIWQIMYYAAVMTVSIVTDTPVGTAFANLGIAVAKSIIQLYIVTFIQVIPVVICEWKRIVCHPAKKILYMFAFPLFDLLNMPITLIALFTKVEWKPIVHNDATDIDKIDELNEKYNKKER